MRTPRVSVILPTFNRADVLPRAVDSVLRQTFGELELLVVDDGSTDQTASYLERITDVRCRTIRLEANGGVSAARNVGIRVARGDLLAFQDSDDLWQPTKLERQVARFDEGDSDLGVVGCGWTLTFRGRTTVTKPTVRGSIYREVLASEASCLGTPMLVTRHLEAREQPLFDASLPALVERDFVLQYARRFRIDFVDEPLVEVTRGRADHVANPSGALVAYERYIEKYREDMLRWPEIRADYHARAAKAACRLGRRPVAWRHFREARNGPDTRADTWLTAPLGLAFGDSGLRLAARLRRRGHAASRM
jgi:glycosyltransferase involved in cell wall biosynthesis